jgi:hypothetical protein
MLNIDITPLIVKSEGERTNGATASGNSTRSPKDWAEVISTSWTDNTAGVFKTGNYLLAACDQLGKDYVVTKLKLPFGKRTAERLMAIAGNPVLATHVSQLPPCWSTLYELSRLNDDVLKSALANGRIHLGMERKDTLALKPKTTTGATTTATATTNSPDLNGAWEAASDNQRRKFLDQLGRNRLCAALSDGLKADIRDHAIGVTIAGASKSSSWAINATNKLHSAMRIAEQQELDAESKGRSIGALRCIALTAERRGIARSDIVIAEGKPRKGRT